MKKADKFKVKTSCYIYLFEGASVVLHHLVLLVDREACKTI